MFKITCDWSLFSLHLFVEVKLDLLTFYLFITFEIHFDTFTPIPIVFDTFPQNPQGEWN